MKLLLLIFALLLLVQQYILYNERQKLCTLIAVIEHHEDITENDVPSPKLIAPCVLPKHIESPRWDLGQLKPQEN